MTFEQLCVTMKEYFSKFSWARVLFPLSSVIMYVCAAVQVVNNWISFGSVVSQITYFAFFFVLLLTLAQCKFLDAAIGLGIFALDYAIAVISALLPPYSYIYYSGLISLLVYGGLAFLAYKKSVSFR